MAHISEVASLNKILIAPSRSKYLTSPTFKSPSYVRDWLNENRERNFRNSSLVKGKHPHTVHDGNIIIRNGCGGREIRESRLRYRHLAEGQLVSWRPFPGSVSSISFDDFGTRFLLGSRLNLNSMLNSVFRRRWGNGWFWICFLMLRAVRMWRLFEHDEVCRCFGTSNRIFFSSDWGLWCLRWCRSGSRRHHQSDGLYLKQKKIWISRVQLIICQSDW